MSVKLHIKHGKNLKWKKLNGSFAVGFGKRNTVHLKNAVVKVNLSDVELMFLWESSTQEGKGCQQVHTVFWAETLRPNLLDASEDT
jgi:hypothetical protein